MSLFILAGIIALLFVSFGGYFGFSNASGKVTSQVQGLV